ncbi:MAG: ABC transporter ATP-binding protein [Bythopirellula sp.]
MISIQDLVFSYDREDFCLRIQELSISDAERVAWLGPSGSGKTTLLHLVAGILSPVAGLINTCGVELTALSDAQRRDFRITNCGLAFQEFELLDYLTVLDNVLLPYRINRTMQLTAAVKQSAAKLLEQVGVQQAASRRPNQLSHGQRQRVAVCRALVTQPKLVLADEPTANLDPDNKHRVLDLLDEYVNRTGATLVVVTHDHQVAERFARTVDLAEFAGEAHLGPAGANHHA